ncbi:MAG: hypothetical protein ACQET3_11935, partial [Promethearchaeati archaeon]
MKRPALHRNIGRRSAITLLYVLAIGSGVMRAFSVSFDVFAINNLISDAIAYGFLSQWISGLITIILVAILSIRIKSKGRKRSIGSKLDPDFSGISLPPREPTKYIALGGILAGVSSFFYYVLVSSMDASAILPYGQLTILYLLMGDLLAEKDTPTAIEIQCIISVLLGAILVGVQSTGFNLPALLIVLGPMNLTSAGYTYCMRNAKRYKLERGRRFDSLNLRLWTLLFLNLSLSTAMTPFLMQTDWESVMNTVDSLIYVIIGSSATIFLSVVMYVRALGMGRMAVVNSLSAISVVLGIPITLIGNLILPGSFGAIAEESLFWILKMFGVLLVISGVIVLETSDVRSLVVVKVKPQTGDIIELLWAINGVESVSALAGKHDYL